MASLEQHLEHARGHLDEEKTSWTTEAKQLEEKLDEAVKELEGMRDRLSGLQLSNR